MYSKCGKLMGILSAIFMGLWCAMPALAQEAAEAAPASASAPAGFNFTIEMAMALSMALAAIGGSIAQSMVASKAVEGIARNPEADSKIRLSLLLSLGFIESLSIYVLLLAFVLR